MKAFVRRWAVVGAVCTAAAIAPWGILFAVNGMRADPVAQYLPHECTRHCHNHGCKHTPVLPAALASDSGLYGATIQALKRGGTQSGLGARRGYGAVNLLVFCALWPLLMLMLLGVALWQRSWIRTWKKRVRSHSTPPETLPLSP